MKERQKIKIKGRVQGVGFRPAVYRIAKKYSLSGFVYNSSDGVVIEVEGEKEKIKKFLENIEKNPPSRAKIKDIEAIKISVKGKRYLLFDGLKSSERQSSQVAISGEISTSTLLSFKLSIILNFFSLFTLIFIASMSFIFALDGGFFSHP